MTNLHEIFGEPISTYTRCEALEDGVLVEAQDPQGKGLFKWPVAYTQAVYTDFVEWTDEDTARRRVHQDQSGREWDLLFMLSQAAKSGRLDRNRGLFQFYAVSRKDGAKRAAQLVTLRAVLGPDDEGNPALTVMLPHED